MKKMSEILQQKKKAKKTYQQLLDEVKSMMSNTAAIFIPQLCEALKEERPELTNEEIQADIYRDCHGIWEDSTIYKSFPSWIYDQGAVKRSKKGWETRYANELRSAEKLSAQLTRIHIPEPKLETKIQDTDIELEDAELTKYGDKGKTLLTKYGDITRPIAELFSGLTEHEYMPHVDEDVILDHIKPTREYRRGIVLELDEEKRTTLHNWLAWVDLAIHDMLALIQEADK